MEPSAHLALVFKLWRHPPRDAMLTLAMLTHNWETHGRQDHLIPSHTHPKDLPTEKHVKCLNYWVISKQRVGTSWDILKVIFGNIPNSSHQTEWSQLKRYGSAVHSVWQKIQLKVCKRWVYDWLYCQHQNWGRLHIITLKLGQTSKEHLPSERHNYHKTNWIFVQILASVGKYLDLLEWFWWYSWPKVV